MGKLNPISQYYKDHPQYNQKDDEACMKVALDLAENGLYTTTPNPCVGCAIFKFNPSKSMPHFPPIPKHMGQNSFLVPPSYIDFSPMPKLIGQGFHIQAGTPHAEVNALNNLLESAEGATVYVTLEPCSHYGRTPPCADALVKAKPARVVIATKDPNPLVAGKGIKILEDAGIEVTVGICEKKALELNKAYMWRMQTGLPYIRLKQAVSLDGGIALSNGESKWITSEKAREDVQVYRAKSSAILTTSKTVIADDPYLTVRSAELPQKVIFEYPLDYIRQPHVVVLDSKAQISPEANIFKNRDRRVFLVVSSQTRIEKKYPNHCTIVFNNDQSGDLTGVFKELVSQHNINDLWVEAGAHLVSSLIKQNLFNEYIIYMAPKLLGNFARHMNQLEDFKKLTCVPELKFAKVTQVGSDLKIILESKKKKAKNGSK